MRSIVADTVTQACVAKGIPIPSMPKGSVLSSECGSLLFRSVCGPCTTGAGVGLDGH